MLTIYKASAGSGKTYRLALEYVRLLLGVKDEASGCYRLDLPRYTGAAPRAAAHRHILAITFTNKATEEMKRRIVDELASLASDHADGSADCDLVTELIAEFGCTREELRAVAARALRSLLFDYHHFNVSTIDSFFQTVLRSFAREIDRQGDYSLELNDDLAVSTGIGLMLDDLNYGRPQRRAHIMEWIRNYTMDLVGKGKDGSLFNRSGFLLRRLAAYVRKMGSEVFKKQSSEVLAYLEDPARMKAFTEAISNRIASLSAPLAERARGLIGHYRSSGFDDAAIPSTVWRIIDTVITGEPLNPVTAFKSIGVRKVLGFDESGDTSFYVKKYLPGGKNPVFPPDDFTAGLCSLMQDCRAAAVESTVLRQIAAACPSLEFLGFTWHYINRFRTENNLILLSDTNDLLQRIIGESSAPFIYERIGVVLRHFLIDEFQDTSHMQWHNLKRLVENSLAEGCDNLIIGDEKQAIYRFRNSDSSLLHHVVMNEDFPDDSVLRGNNASENTNYRSAADIVRFNNALFTRIAANCGLEGYENTIQTPKKKDVPGLVRIYDTAGLASINGMPAEFAITAREIIRQHEAGYRWSDIAVLMRRRDEAEQMVSYLLKYHPGIRVLSDEALLLRNSPAVKTVVSMLKLVAESYGSTPPDRMNSTTGTPVFGTSGDIRLMISRYDYFHSDGYGSGDALRHALDAPAGDNEAQDINDSVADIRSSHASGLVSLVETIIAKKVPPSRRVSEYAYLAAFQDEVIGYCSKFNPSVHAFLEWWDEASAKLAISAGTGQDAVAVMTVHKSKGLQWACVHVPFGDWELVRNDDNVWIHPHLDFVDPAVVPPLLAVDINAASAMPGSPLYAEAMRNRSEQLVDNVNTTYVAYTRPERELTVCFRARKQAGAEVFKALAAPAAGKDPEFCTDLAAYMRENSGDGPVFQLGEPTAPLPRQETVSPSGVHRSGDYRVYLRPDTSRYTTIDDVTADAGDIMSDSERPDETSLHEPLLPENLRQAAERGIHLHSVMADIDSLSDIDTALARAAVRLRLEPDVTAEYTAIISRAFDSAGEHVDRWFADGVTALREQSIYVPERDITLRPDRIVIDGDGSVEVVDYKFTAEPLPGHRRQVEGYVALLRSMGYEKVTGYLWYPELNNIIRV